MERRRRVIYKEEENSVKTSEGPIKYRKFILVNEK